MATAIQIGANEQSDGKARAVLDSQPFFSISDLAARWRCSRGTVYNVLRGQPVLDFAATGKKGHKVVPLEIVLKIECARMKVWR
jgi:hypothetical protein